jgi:hypothetical protein
VFVSAQGFLGLGLSNIKSSQAPIVALGFVFWLCSGVFYVLKIEPTTNRQKIKNNGYVCFI